MSEIWNDFELKRPPLITLQHSKAIFACGLHRSIGKYMQWEKEQSKEFAHAAALLSRLMARRKNSFRRMIGFRTICKLNAALCRLLRLDFPRDLENFHSALPDMAYGPESTAELPTRNNLDYVLVRLMGVHRLHERIRLCCIEAADHFTKMLRMNFFLEMNTLLLAVFAKLHSQSIVLGNRCAVLYGELLRYRNSFPSNANYTLLPADAQLPTKLQQAVENAASESVADSNISAAANVTMTPLLTNAPKQRETADEGVAIERAEAKRPAFNFDQLASVEAAKKFIKSEHEARKQAPKNCVTRKIQAHEWQGATKLFERKLLADDHKKALNVFRKFISSKI